MSEAEEALPRGTKRWLEALTWHETLTEADASQLRSSVIRDWQGWYADPENERVFDNLIRLASDGSACALRKNRERSPRHGDSVVSMAVWGRKRISKGSQDHSPPAARWRPWLNAAVGVVVLIAMAILISGSPWGRFGASPGAGAVTYETAVGELRKVHLDDGSNITLGGSTELMVALGRKARAVQLIRGEAWFTVAHDPKWPFIVRAGDRDVRAVGTAFLVTRESDRVVVTVTEGTVAVTAFPPVRLSPIFSRAAGMLRLPPIRVTRGEEVSYRDNGAIASVTQADTDAATAWTNGRLVFEDESLRYVIENVNRYFPRHIYVSPGAARLRFSGVIFDGEIDDWLHGLSRAFPVDVDESGPSICIHLRGSYPRSSCASPQQ